ncbi:MAG: tRNA (adenosine(37)-N6)-dimethylallyltransferase MiaA [Actinomycetota bacterium]
MATQTRATRVAVVGATASGKSQLAMAAARELGDVDLVSVDSMQVYRGMDIGTAKASQGDREAVPHHCIDLVEPYEEFTVARFQHAANLAADEVEAAARRVVYVGGTGLYHRAVIDRFDLPGEFPEARAAVRAELERDGLDAAYRRLERADPAAAARVEPGNERRIARALEVIDGAGRPFSSFGPGVDHYPESPTIQVGLRWSRARLAERIEQRVHAMVDAGLVAEVEGLLAAGLSRTAGHALGYKELRRHLEGATSLDAAIDATITRTRQFATRQDRWFRRDPRVRWVDAEPDPVAAALPAVLDALRR